MLHKLKKSNEGFTIIEVLIVLAIAGLILLVVFLAVPALQRNQRNNARKTDASRLGGAITNFVSNNNGTLPKTTAAGWPVDGLVILQDVGTFGQYPFTGVATDLDTSGGGVNNKFTSTSTAVNTALAPTGKNEQVRLVVGAVCDTAGATKPGTNRQMALQYTLENSSGTYGACLDVN